MAWHIQRLLSSDEQRELFALVTEIGDRELAPQAAAHEAASQFPREVIRMLGKSGLLSLPYPVDYGGGSQPYEIYLQVLEEIARRWAAVAVSLSVHSLACYPTANFGTEQQRMAWLPTFLNGESLGAYCLSESHAGSDPSAMRTRARRLDDGRFVLSGEKAWVTHGGVADFYNVFARLDAGSDDSGGISCFLVRAGTPGLSFGALESKMGLTSSPTASVLLDEVIVDHDALIGDPGDGLRIAFSALDSGRLGIAACAVGLAQGALDAAIDYAQEREQFGHALIDHQGVGFLLADMSAAVESSRATYVDAARKRDAGMAFSKAASTAKLVSTDAAMKVTTDAVQVFGGAGYTKDFPVERYMREAKVMQIFEGTNQIQRLAIAKHLRKGQGAGRTEGVRQI